MFLVADLGQYDVFLGFSWFFAENPQIDCSIGTLKVTTTNEVNGVTTDLAITAGQQQLATQLPRHLQKYACIFSDQEAMHVPPS